MAGRHSLSRTQLHRRHGSLTRSWRHRTSTIIIIIITNTCTSKSPCGVCAMLVPTASSSVNPKTLGTQEVQASTCNKSVSTLASLDYPHIMDVSCLYKLCKPPCLCQDPLLVHALTLKNPTSKSPFLLLGMSTALATALSLEVNVSSSLPKRSPHPIATTITTNPQQHLLAPPPLP